MANNLSHIPVHTAIGIALSLCFVEVKMNRVYNLHYFVIYTISNCRKVEYLHSNPFTDSEKECYREGYRIIRECERWYDKTAKKEVAA